MLQPNEVIDRYFLETRCMLVEIAATLDRFDRAVVDSHTTPPDDARWQLIRQSLAYLASTTQPNRSEQLLMMFSDPN